MQITLNGQPHELDQPVSVATLLERLELAGKPCAVEVNQTLVPAKQHADRTLAEGDSVELVTLVGGG